MPNVFLPSISPQHTTPLSRIAPASDPASGPVKAKQGISSPRAKRGK